MKDFNYYAPTQVAFGRKAEQATGRLVKQYGGTKSIGTLRRQKRRTFRTVRRSIPCT